MGYRENERNNGKTDGTKENHQINKTKNGL